MLIYTFRGKENLFCVKTKRVWSLQRIVFVLFCMVLLCSLEKGKPTTMLY